MATHLLDHAHGDMAAIEVGVEQAQPMGLALNLVERGGAGQDQDLVGDLGRGYPDLLPRQHIVIAAAIGPDLDGGGVEPGIRLGHGKASLVLAGDQRRQHAAFLLLGPEHDHRLEPEDIDVDRRRAAHGGAGFRDRLHHQHGLGDAETGSAVLFRHRDPEPASRGQGGMKLMGKIAGAILLQPIGIVELGAELADLIADLLLLRAQREIHCPVLPIPTPRL